MQSNVNIYKSLVKGSTGYINPNLREIHKIISNKKEYIIRKLLDNNELKDPNKAEDLLIDIESNKWKVNKEIIEELNEIIDNQ